mgnify:CR=1 FL=1
MTIKDYPSTLEDIEKRFYSATVNQIRGLAVKGDFINAYKFIQRASLNVGIKKKLFDEVKKMSLMQGSIVNNPEKNPYK